MLGDKDINFSNLSKYWQPLQFKLGTKTLKVSQIETIYFSLFFHIILPPFLIRCSSNNLVVYFTILTEFLVTTST